MNEYIFDFVTDNLTYEEILDILFPNCFRETAKEIYKSLNARTIDKLFDENERALVDKAIYKIQSKKVPVEPFDWDEFEASQK